MSIVVPFIHGLDNIAEQAWLTELNKHSNSFKVKPLHRLTNVEKQKAQVSIIANPDPKNIANLPNLTWVQSLWAGVDKLVTDLPANIGIARLIDPQLANTMAEAVLTWVLYLHRHIPDYIKQQYQQNWHPHPVSLAEHKTIAVLGLGKLGLKSALRLHDNGFRVVGWSKNKKPDNLPIETLSGEPALKSLLAMADIVVILLPLTHETKGLFDSKLFDNMKQGASIINFARGQIIEESALLNALNNNIHHAVLDVFDKEPLPQDHPYWLRDNISVLPHISAITNKQTASKIAMDNIKNYVTDFITPELVDRSRNY